MINKGEIFDGEQRISERNSKSSTLSQDRLNSRTRVSDDSTTTFTATTSSQANSWKHETSKADILQRDCSDDNRSTINLAGSTVSNLPAASCRLNNSTTDISSVVNKDNLINIGDISKQIGRQPLAQNVIGESPSLPRCLSLQSHSQQAGFTTKPPQNNPGDSKRVRFKSLLSSSTSLEHDTANETIDISDRELATSNFFDNSSRNTIYLGDINNISTSREQQHEISLQDKLYYNKDNNLDEVDESCNLSSDIESEEENKPRHSLKSSNNSGSSSAILKLNGGRSKRLSSKTTLKQSFGRRVLNRLATSINSFTNDNYPYVAYEDKDLLTGATKYTAGKRRQSKGRTFRGSYRYSRADISMAILKKIGGLLFQKSTCALFGAFLIHVTLGTVYTLSNINSYLTSYMREHGSPNATYGASMWISSSYAVGQGFSMVLGGYIEKRFSAQLACIIGCALHSISIMSTSWSVDHGPLAVLVTYGFIPGFGCGLAYMTPMSNGFGWYPNRKGLVAGVILAGFGIGTFIFNMAQTAFVNPNNLSPPKDYFTQPEILDKVPQLFVFIGSIYAAMQFVGCCLLFKPPNTNYGLTSSSSDKLDERPILVETEMSLKRAVNTREFYVLFLVYGITTQGVLFVNSMIKEYGQIFIGNDMYLAWVGSMASIANSMGRLVWGLAIDRFDFTSCFTCITIIFGSIMFIMPFEFVLSSKLLYLLCTLAIFGSFSGWMSTYPVHLSRVFGRTNSGMIYGLIFVSQSCGGIVMAFVTQYLIDHFNRFVPFFCVVFLEILGLAIYHLFYPK